MSRDYPFELPLNVPSFYMRSLVQKVVESGLWADLPVALINKLNDAYRGGQGVEITKEDLDTIPDRDWSRVLKVIG